MKTQKFLPSLYLRKDLLTKNDLQEITNRVIRGNEFLGDIVYDYNCHIYSLNRYICANNDIREQFDKFIEDVRENILKKDKKDLTQDENQKILIANEITEINEKSRDANEAINLLETKPSREVAQILTISKTKMYDTLKAMGFEKSKEFKQWIHVDNKDLPNNIEGLKRDLDLIDLYTTRYGDFNLYNSDVIIKMVDAEIMEDIRSLSEELNYEAEEDLMNLLLLRGLQIIDYRNIKRKKNEDEYKNINLTVEEHIRFLHDGEEKTIEFYKDKLINKYGFNKKKINKMTPKEIFILYKTQE